MRVENNVMVPMRDGVGLATKLFFPDDRDTVPWPVIAIRTPYDKEMMPLGFDRITGDGYVLALQDARGRFESEGRFQPLAQEAEDGVDLIGWLREQAWCNGSIGMASGSYVGATQWLPAVENPEGLLMASPMITGSLFNGFGFYARGVVQLDVFLLWHASLADEENRRRGIDYSDEHSALKDLRETSAKLIPLMIQSMNADPSSPEAGELQQALVDLQQSIARKSEAYLSMPLNKAASQLEAYAPWLTDWLRNIDDPDAPFWQSFDWARRRDDVSVPMLHLAGWHDLFVRGQLKDFAVLSARENGPFQKLIVSPDAHATHNNPQAVPMGEVLFPCDVAIDMNMMVKTPAKENGELYGRWNDQWLKGVDTGLVDEAPITLYVQGDNVWRDEWEWPLSRTQWTPLYLKSGGSANRASGDGGLSWDQPTSGEVDRFRYDPADPVPSKGGTFLNLGIPPGMFEQSEIESRPDVLVYTSKPLEAQLEVTGPVSMKLWAATSAVDTDFTGKLLDVDADGNSYNICDGVTRLRHRKDAPGPVTPNEVQQLEIELSPTSYVFKAGHRIRLQVSSSNFPLFDPNPNTGKSLFTDTGNEMVVAEQTVFHDADRPSHILLPIIPSFETQ